MVWFGFNQKKETITKVINQRMFFNRAILKKKQNTQTMEYLWFGEVAFIHRKSNEK